MPPAALTAKPETALDRASAKFWACCEAVAPYAKVGSAGRVGEGLEVWSASYAPIPSPGRGAHQLSCADYPLASALLLQTALHVGFIPAIIVIGMTATEPRPSLAQLLGPM